MTPAHDIALSCSRPGARVEVCYASPWTNTRHLIVHTDAWPRAVEIGVWDWAMADVEPDIIYRALYSVAKDLL